MILPDTSVDEILQRMATRVERIKGQIDNPLTLTQLDCLEHDLELLIQLVTGEAE